MTPPWIISARAPILRIGPYRHNNPRQNDTQMKCPLRGPDHFLPHTQLAPLYSPVITCNGDLLPGRTVRTSNTVLRSPSTPNLGHD